MGSTNAAKEILLNAGIILAVGTLFAVVAQRIKLPDVAVFLIVGIGLGPGALGWDDFSGRQRVQSDHPDFRRLLSSV